MYIHIIALIVILATEHLYYQLVTYPADCLYSHVTLFTSKGKL